MSLSASDLLHDADVFRRAYPRWPSAEPEESAMSAPDPADVAGRSLDEMVRDERWQEAES